MTKKKTKKALNNDRVANNNINNNDKNNDNANGTNVLKQAQPVRLYQKELFEMAIKRNVIIRSDTGTGKTFIATMCARHFHNTISVSPSDNRKLIILIVPTVALVSQQVDQFKNNTSLAISGFTGDMSVDLWSKDKWIQEINKADVLVMTAQILYNLFSVAYLSIHDIALLIFDEAHHAMKQHPYNRIMQLAYHPFLRDNPDRKHELPHIIGLTASPIYNSSSYDSMRKSIATLEANLNALVVEAKAQVKDLANYSHRPKQRVVYYNGYQSDDSESQLEFFVIDSLNRLQIEINREEVVIWRQEFGFYGTYSFYLKYLEGLIHDMTKELMPGDPVVQELVKLKKDIIKMFPYSQQLENTDKVQQLLKTLGEFRNLKDFYGIIFVERRTHTELLVDIINKTEGLSYIRACALVGHNMENGPGMSVKSQQNAIDGFRNGTYNVLVATQVAEEGLDFPKCNLVIRYDTVQTITSFVQSRGRARDANSHYIVMVDRQDNCRNKIETFVQNEKAQHHIYTERTGEEEVDEPDYDDTEIMIHPETGAKLDYQSAISRLQIICSQMSRDPFTPQQKPEYEILGITKHSGIHYFATVKLPPAPYLPPNNRFIEGPLMPSKSQAKQAVAFEACKVIYNNGGLDNHFMPFKRKKITREQRKSVMELSIQELQNRSTDELLQPDSSGNIQEKISFDCTNPFGAFNVDKKVWVQTIFMTNINDPNEVMCLGLISPRYLHMDRRPFKIWSRYKCMVCTVKFGEAYELSKNMNEEQRQELWKLLDKFARQLSQMVVNRKSIETKISHHIIPMKRRSKDDPGIGAEEYIPDWFIINNLLTQTTLEELKPGLLVTSPYRGSPASKLYHVEAIRPELDIMSKLTNTETYEGVWYLAKSLKKFENFKHFLAVRMGVTEEEVYYPMVQLKAIDPAAPYYVSTRVEPPTQIVPQSIPDVAPPDWYFADTINYIPKCIQDKLDAIAAGTYVEENNVDDCENNRAPEDVSDEDDNDTSSAQRNQANAQGKAGSKKKKRSRGTGGNTGNQGALQNLRNERNGKIQARVVLPLSTLRTPPVDLHWLKRYRAIPTIIRVSQERLTANEAIKVLGLPPIDTNLLIEALTLPSCNAELNYQSLETFGDSVLKIATTVNVYIEYYNMEEGILSAQRQRKLDNFFLAKCAIEKGLGRFVISELMQLTNWIPPSNNHTETLDNEGYSFKREVHPKALADVVEAILGAAFLTGVQKGGIPSGVQYALKAGDALGMDFGGSTPWTERKHYPVYGPVPTRSDLIPLCNALGYKFVNGDLLIQAITHRSDFNSNTCSYERDEFLGDAILDLCIMRKLYNRFPWATPKQLSQLRSSLVNNSVLSFIAVKYLEVHKYISHSSEKLNESIISSLAEIDQLTAKDILDRHFVLYFPKVLADVVESCLGSIFIDSGYRLEIADKCVQKLFVEFFDILDDDPPDDPTSNLIQWEQRVQCRRMKRYISKQNGAITTVEIRFHGQVVGKGAHSKKNIARAMAADAAYKHVLELEQEVDEVCSCAREIEQEKNDFAEVAAAAAAKKKEAEADNVNTSTSASANADITINGVNDSGESSLNMDDMHEATDAMDDIQQPDDSSFDVPMEADEDFKEREQIEDDMVAMEYTSTGQPFATSVGIYGNTNGVYSSDTQLSSTNSDDLNFEQQVDVHPNGIPQKQQHPQQNRHHHQYPEASQNGHGRQVHPSIVSKKTKQKYSLKSPYANEYGDNNGIQDSSPPEVEDKEDYDEHDDFSYNNYDDYDDYGDQDGYNDSQSYYDANGDFNYNDYKEDASSFNYDDYNYKEDGYHDGNKQDQFYQEDEYGYQGYDDVPQEEYIDDEYFETDYEDRYRQPKTATTKAFKPKAKGVKNSRSYSSRDYATTKADQHTLYNGLSSRNHNKYYPNDEYLNDEEYADDYPPYDDYNDDTEYQQEVIYSDHSDHPENYDEPSRHNEPAHNYTNGYSNDMPDNTKNKSIKREYDEVVQSDGSDDIVIFYDSDEEPSPKKPTKNLPPPEPSTTSALPRSRLSQSQSQSQSQSNSRSRYTPKSRRSNHYSFNVQSQSDNNNRSRVNGTARYSL